MVEAVSIPVIGAGGVADGAGAAAVFMLGADVAQAGTRLSLLKNQMLTQNFKNKTESYDIDTVVCVGCWHPVRAIKNKLASPITKLKKISGW